jgi:hypothetical protein
VKFSINGKQVTKATWFAHHDRQQKKTRADTLGFLEDHFTQCVLSYIDGNKAVVIARLKACIAQVENEK